MPLFSDISKQSVSYERRREDIIKSSREILKDAKLASFMCLEGNATAAALLIRQISRAASNYERIYSKPLRGSKVGFSLYSEGSWCAGIEEYLESWFLYQYIVKRKIVEPMGVRPTVSVYVGALSDFTGELVRLAVREATDKDRTSVAKIRQTIASVVGFLISLHATGQSRTKVDAAKRNLKRVEEILYELTIRI